MRRVVITGLGIVSCLGNDKDTVSANLRAGRPGIRFNPSYAEMGLRSHVSGSVDLNLEEADRSQGLPLHGRCRRLRLPGDGAGDQGLRPDSGTDFQPPHRPDRRLRRRFHPEPDGSHRHPARERRQAHRPIPRDPHHGQHRIGLPGHTVPDQGRQLLDLLRLRHQRPLHRPSHGTDPVGQAGRGLRRRRRRGTLEPELPVRRHGRPLHPVQRHSGKGLPRLRRQA